MRKAGYWIAICFLLCASSPLCSQTAERLPKIRIPDVLVVDQDNHPRHFYSDLVKGKTVAINFVFTTCTTICPPLGAAFGKLEKNLGSHVDKDVFLISVSVDPATDTPERLRAWAGQFGAKPGWSLVTGEREQVDRLLRALGSDAGAPENHSPMVLIGNDKTGAWKRVYGLGSTTVLTQDIEQMMSASPPKN